MTTRTTITAGLVALAALTLTGCEFADAMFAPPTTPTAASGPAADLFAGIPTAPEDTTAPYDRDQWPHWSNHGDGCDTRELVLAAQGVGIRHGKACRPLCPLGGPACWTSPYDGEQLHDPARVHIDHRVPLAEAARSGAAGWTTEQRERFANDVNNLVAASVSSNTSKGDDDPARWQPPNHAVWCDYATGYVTTKATYGLTVDQAERNALAAMLATCPTGGAR